MSLVKTTGKTAAALSVALLATGLAQAEKLGALGSTDIYSTNFQQTFAALGPVAQEQGAMGAVGSVDIYRTDFRKMFPSSSDPVVTTGTEVVTGTVDIYSTNFQKTSL